MDEPTGLLAGKTRKIIPYIPPWKAEGTHSVQMLIEGFTDRAGNRAIVCTAHYKDKKNKDRECTAWVKWEDQQ
jgi:hypothetical protein